MRWKYPISIILKIYFGNKKKKITFKTNITGIIFSQMLKKKSRLG